VTNAAPTRFCPLTTARLVLRDFEPSDVPAFVAYRNDPEVARYQAWSVPYPDDTGARFVAALADLEPGTPGAWYQLAITEPGAGLVGDVGVHVRASDRSTCDIGYTLARSAWGRGYATEAVSRVVTWLVEDLGIGVVAAEFDERNLASARLLARLGFSPRDGARRAVWADGGWVFERGVALPASRWLDRLEHAAEESPTA
jgi:RimJ/RimL family protein N-acetyltransferase